MGGILESLRKAGIVSDKHAKKLEASNRKQQYDAHKNKELSQKLQAQKKKEADEIQQMLDQRRELDKELNKQRDLMLARRENIYRARQLLNSNSLNVHSATEPYYFAEGTIIRMIRVTPWQREMLARGKMGIGRPLEGFNDFVIIPLQIARKVHEIFPEKILTLHSELDDTVELDSILFSMTKE